ncbi:hypothetical protein AWC02_20550 [Mycolicibacter engbaekii]|uniref:Uncharacterized protein n=1 Tax=Mycolicibacter engbaekii TaxID=188915 RepID=A0A1X1T5E4_9MYCO|nr:hypothetical protein [Mycolicibacter engbaekii]ORV39757.1 hypothetical protein AWC02_20550 [Mycolicibacter engbaekii]
MKQLYERHSTASTPERLDAAVRAAIGDHAAAHQLGDVLAQAQAICETHSVRLYRGGLLARITGSADADREHRSVAALTPRYLVIAVSGEKRGTHVRSARLEAISTRPGLAGVPDFGVDVVGHWSGATDDQADAGFYLGLGADQSGQDFADRLRAAVSAAKAR